MNPAAFKDFIVCKALDVISGNGAYRKYLHQCCENGEEWALSVATNIAAVGVVIKDLHALVDRVRRLPNSKLGKVCGEIVSSMHSPVRVIPGWSTCERSLYLFRKIKTSNSFILRRHHYRVPGPELHRCQSSDKAKPDHPSPQQVPLLHAHALLHAQDRARCQVIEIPSPFSVMHPVTRPQNLHQAMAGEPAAGCGHERPHRAIQGAGCAVWEDV